MNKKKYYIIFLSVFCIYLLMANTIFTISDNNEKLKKVKFEKFQSNSEAYVCLDACQNIGGLLEIVYVQGWGYCETENDNSNKKVVLIFKSVNSNLCYSVETNAQLRQDVYGAFRNEKKIYNGMNGIDTQFSTVKMKSGKYHFYVQVIENDINYGIVDMNQVYKKDGTGLTLINE